MPSNPPQKVSIFHCFHPLHIPPIHLQKRPDVDKLLFSSSTWGCVVPRYRAMVAFEPCSRMPSKNLSFPTLQRLSLVTLEGNTTLLPPSPPLISSFPLQSYLGYFTRNRRFFALPTVYAHPASCYIRITVQLFNDLLDLSVAPFLVLFPPAPLIASPRLLSYFPLRLSLSSPPAVAFRSLAGQELPNREAVVWHGP